MEHDATPGNSASHQASDLLPLRLHSTSRYVKIVILGWNVADRDRKFCQFYKLQSFRLKPGETPLWLDCVIRFDIQFTLKPLQIGMDRIMIANKCQFD